MASLINLPTNFASCMCYCRINKIIDFILQRYLKLNISKDLRSMLTKLRISAHSLAIETGRYGTTKIPADQRFCKFCPTNVEDEVHFLFQCPQCNLLRNEYDIP
jgi:hypothetical protein